MMIDWLGINKAAVEQTLRNKYSVSDHMAPDIATKISLLDTRLHREFKKFWAGQPFDPDVTIEGWSYSRLLEELGINPIGAWVSLDWLCKEPNETKVILSKGIK